MQLRWSLTGSVCLSVRAGVSEIPFHKFNQFKFKAPMPKFPASAASEIFTVPWI